MDCLCVIVWTVLLHFLRCITFQKQCQPCNIALSLSICPTSCGVGSFVVVSSSDRDSSIISALRCLARASTVRHDIATSCLMCLTCKSSVYVYSIAAECATIIVDKFVIYICNSKTYRSHACTPSQRYNCIKSTAHDIYY